MSVPQCQAQHCAGVADDGMGMCAAHRRSLTLSTKMQDAVREFLGGNANACSAVAPTTENTRTVSAAGTQIAQALALLVSTLFGSDVSYDDTPITLGDLSHSATTPWRVTFNWRAAMTQEIWNEEQEEEEDDDELEDDQQ